VGGGKIGYRCDDRPQPWSPRVKLHKGGPERNEVIAQWKEKKNDENRCDDARLRPEFI
jgi:hypothetical protein